MILELKIRNFLSFKEEVTFSFEATADKTLDDYYVVQKKDGTRILKMMMVYGANASGKSNLIEAFEFIYDFVRNIPDEKDEETNFIPFRFDQTKDEPGEFNLWFYIGEKKHRYQLILNQDTVLEEKLFYYPSSQPAILFSRYFDTNMKISVIEFGSKIKISKQAQEAIQLKTLKNTSVFAACNQVNLSLPELEIVLEWFNEQYLASINPYTLLTEFSESAIKNDSEIKEQALKFLKEADFNITDIKYEERTKPVPEFFLKSLDSAPIRDEEKEQIKKDKLFHYNETLFEHKIINSGKEEFYFLEDERQSKGTIRYYGLSAPFFYAIKNNAFLPIDEIGSALHPILVIHFITEFLKKSKEAQLLFTTHNMSILNEKEILRKDAIWFTEKQENGATDLFSMADFPIRKELSYYNAYKLGKFGAIPEL
ncbi:MAG: ATP-binding protein [Salinivirgaceae bacterium]|nr:ATP-binding protein [Salinivirgaceae bacterium]